MGTEDSSGALGEKMEDENMREGASDADDDGESQDDQNKVPTLLPATLMHG